jgi:hypothetical protein
VVLLLTCANIATLTLVRFVSRRREMAIRQFLGANRLQLVRRMLLRGYFCALRRSLGVPAHCVDREVVRVVHSAQFEPHRT